MRSCRCMLLALSVGVLCSHAYGEIVVAEYNEYVEGTDYSVVFFEGLPRITILRASLPDRPYDFDCYDDSTDPPYEPATIQWITALRNIGNVEIMVRGHEDRQFGASNVRLLQLNQEGVSSTVTEFKIEADLGADGETYVDQIAGTFDVGKFVRTDVYIQTLAPGSTFEALQLDENLYVTGAGPHAVV